MAISSGDIAFLGYNSSGPDQIAVLIRNAIAAGDSFIITDGGYISATGVAGTDLYAEEGFIQYTAPAGGIPAGVVLVISSGDGGAPSVTRNGGGDAGTVTLLANASGSTSNFLIGEDGDSLIAYTVSGGDHLTGTPTYLALAAGTAGDFSLSNPTQTSNTTISPFQRLILGNFDNNIFRNASLSASANQTELSTVSLFTRVNTTPSNFGTLPSSDPNPFTTGDDVIAPPGNSKSDVYDGLAGFDELDLTAATSAIVLDAVNGTITNIGFGRDRIANIEFFKLGGGGDSVTLGDSGFVVRAGGGNDTVTGGTGRDLISGGNGDDALDGGTGTANELGGGAGNDTYNVRAIGDSVIEGLSEGTDRVNSFINTYIMTANVEQLFFLGTGNFVGIGNSLNNSITGGAGADFLSGGDGNDTIDGGGGTAANTLVGGAGDDRFLIRTIGDSVIETAGSGTDEAVVSVARHVLAANVENLTFTGTGPHIGIGNSLDNRITGSVFSDFLSGGDGNDTLDGGGGTAVNTLVGGAGDDTYIANRTGDSIVEAANEGIDTVRTSAAVFTLPANVENLIATGGSAGTFAFTGIGNDLDNVITGTNGADFLSGGAGNDTLDGAFGVGRDTFVGGTGDDVFILSAAGGGTVIERPGEGIDTVRTGLLDYTLAANVENLIGTSFGSASLVGNELDNQITAGEGSYTIDGGAGNDTIIGLGGFDVLFGGAGTDTLTSGGGLDRFIVDSGSVDTITDLTTGLDTIGVVRASFVGATIATAFQLSGAPASALTTFIYDRPSGQLFIDVDGAGVGAAVLLANLTPNTALAAGDVLFI